MAIFPMLDREKVVQVGDKTRLSASQSFITKDESAITLVRIRPDTSEAWITVSGVNLSAKDWFIDWVYPAAGTKSATVEITTSGAPVTKSNSITVLSEADDNLFSCDQDLIEFEHDIMRFVRQGRSSWLDFHRKAQALIMDWIDEKGYIDSSGAKLTKASIVDISEVRQWSAALTLSIIYRTLSNAVGDIFDQKAEHYTSQYKEFRQRMVLRLDVDGDGSVDLGEYLNLKSVRMLRR